LPPAVYFAKTSRHHPTVVELCMHQYFALHRPQF
jgi:hypothetical protein